MDTQCIDEEILSLYEKDRWENIVGLSCCLDRVWKSKLFWVLPTIDDLCWIKKIVEKHNLIGVISVGCGCGLFEWLFQRYSGLDVIGIEIDRSWWTSKYSPPLFLKKLLFVRANDKNNLAISPDYALLFCYFNNGTAFCDYLDNYKGKLIFVIGPKSDQHRWTDPMPFDVKFKDHGWTSLCQKVMDRTDDYIVAYVREISSEGIFIRIVRLTQREARWRCSIFQIQYRRTAFALLRTQMNSYLFHHHNIYCRFYILYYTALHSTHPLFRGWFTAVILVLIIVL